MSQFTVTTELILYNIVNNYKILISILREIYYIVRWCSWGCHIHNFSSVRSYGKAGITYQTLNDWLKRGQTEKSGKYYHFFKYIQKCNADAAKTLLERLNTAAKAGDTRICMFILERRFSEEFGRKVYRKTNIVAENLNQNVEIVVTDADKIRDSILEKFTLDTEN